MAVCSFESFKSKLVTMLETSPKETVFIWQRKRLDEVRGYFHDLAVMIFCFLTQGQVLICSLGQASNRFLSFQTKRKLFNVFSGCVGVCVAISTYKI